MRRIRSFADKETEKIYHQEFSRKLPQSIQRIALRKLMMIDNAEKLDDLRIPPANRLEALKGDRRGSSVYGSMINTGFALYSLIQGYIRWESLIIMNNRRIENGDIY